MSAADEEPPGLAPGPPPVDEPPQPELPFAPPEGLGPPQPELPFETVPAEADAASSSPEATPPEPAHADPIAPPPVGRGKPARRKPLWRVLVWTLLVLLFGPPALTLVYRILPPPITLLMVERLAQGQGLHKHWTPLSDMAPALAQAAIASEDAGFCRHHGFDFDAMRKAAAANKRAEARGSAKVRGGSTISQQTAKNVFLWPERSYIRKGLEAYYTILIETLWGKRRILEVYLNVAEWGPGVYGAEAAANRYFDEDASDLTPDQAAHLVAILPSPLKWKAVNPAATSRNAPTASAPRFEQCARTAWPPACASGGSVHHPELAAVEGAQNGGEVLAAAEHQPALGDHRPRPWRDASAGRFSTR